MQPKQANLDLQFLKIPNFQKHLNICTDYTVLSNVEVDGMPTITLSIPEDLKREMDELEFINWSAVCREAIREKASELTLFKSIVSKSKLKEKDASKLAEKISASMHKKYKEKFPGLK
jgi:Arc/MetJ-type ribon-helix-helix transcriptional regulator